MNGIEKNTEKPCKRCKFSTYKGCNRLVIPGGFGCNDKLASDFMKNNECKYFEEGIGDKTITPYRGMYNS